MQTQIFQENAHILTHNSRKHKHAYKQENAITIKVYITQDFHLLCEDEFLKLYLNVQNLSQIFAQPFIAFLVFETFIHGKLYPYG